MMTRWIVAALVALLSFPLFGDACVSGTLFDAHALVYSTSVVGNDAYLLTNGDVLPNGTVDSKPQRLIRLDLTTGAANEVWSDPQIDIDTIVTDGVTLLYTRRSATGIWSRPIAGLSAVLVVPLTDADVARGRGLGAPVISGPDAYVVKTSSVATQGDQIVYGSDAEVLRVPLRGGAVVTVATGLKIPAGRVALAMKPSGLFVLAADGIHRVDNSGDVLVFASTNVRTIGSSDDDNLWFATSTMVEQQVRGGRYEVQIWMLDPHLNLRLITSLASPSMSGTPDAPIVVDTSAQPVRIYSALIGTTYFLTPYTIFDLSYESGGTERLEWTFLSKLLGARGPALYKLFAPAGTTLFTSVARVCAIEPPRRRATR